MNNVFLGKPPANIEAWIKSHQPTPPVQEKTFFWVNGEKNEHDIEGTLDQKWFIDNGYYDNDNWLWLKKISKAELGSKVTTIGRGAFENCSSLTSIAIPDSVTLIDNFAFGNCSSLASVTIPDSVTSIGSDAFGNCSSLASVTILDSVTSIGGSAFEYCDYLTSVTIAHKTMTEVESMITNDYILGYEDYSGKTTTFTCKDGKVEACYDQDAWKVIQIPFNS